MYGPLPHVHTTCSMPMFVCTHTWAPACDCTRESTLCAWVKEWEVFSSAIICRFPYSLFPLCLAHIRHTNSTPLAIPGVLKSRPHSQGKALGAHGGELQTDTLRITTHHTSTSQIRWPTSSHFCLLREALFPTMTEIHPFFKAWPVRSGLRQWVQRRNWNTDGEISSPRGATFKHVFTLSATFYLQRTVCLWSDYRTQQTNKTVQQGECASVSV